MLEEDEEEKRNAKFKVIENKNKLILNSIYKFHEELIVSINIILTFINIAKNYCSSQLNQTTCNKLESI